jgi:hypothetical protein
VNDREPLLPIPDDASTEVIARRIAYSTEFTLDELRTLRDDLDRLALRLARLAEWMRYFRPDLDHAYLDWVADCAAAVTDPAVTEAVRDVSAVLPIRGVEFELGEDLL